MNEDAKQQQDIHKQANDDVLSSLTNEPTVNSTIPQTVVAIKMNSPRKLVWITIAALLLMGGIGATYVFFKPDNKNAPQEKGISQAVEKSMPNETKNTDLPNLLQSAPSVIGASATSTEYLAPDYMVGGYDFYAVSRKEDSNGLTFKIPEGKLQQTASNLGTFLLNNGYKKSAQQVQNAYYPLVKYENSETICGINYYTDYVETLKPLYLSCATKVSYISTAKLQKPFYDAYKANQSPTTVISEDSRLGYPAILDSKTSGYKLGETAIYSEATPTGAKGLFYQTPNGEWKFFIGTQMIVPCNRFDTIELKKAYLDTECQLLDESQTTATVRL